MDKNTLLGFLMMGAVVMGFMYCSRSQQQTQNQTDIQAGQTTAAEQNVILALDSISDEDVTDLRNAIISGGSADADGIYTLVTPYATLSADTAGVIGGMVNTLGDTVVAVEDVINARFGTLSENQKLTANGNLRKVIDNHLRYTDFGKHLYGDSSLVSIGNGDFKLDLSTKGGFIAQATLNNYENYRGSDTTLINLFTPETAAYGFEISTGTRVYNTRDFYFKPVELTDSSVLMKLDFGNDVSFGLRYTLCPNYIVKMEVVQNGMDAVIPTNVSSIALNWHQKMGRNEIGRTFEERNSGIHYKYLGDSPDYLSEYEYDRLELTEQVKWVAFKNQYFSSVMIPRSSFSSANLESNVLKNSADYLKDLNARMTMAYSSASEKPLEIDIFLGPNSYPLLSDLDEQVSPEEDLELTRLIPLGWSLFRWINSYIVIPVFDFLSSFDMNYGIVILLLTIFIKLILLPFTYKSYMSQAKMRVLAPEIKEINDKYPGTENAMVRQQKTMALYSKAGASPFSGCLPMLLQMPVLIAMFSFIPSCIDFRGQGFLWASDLSAPDYIFTLPFAIPFYGDKVSLFCLMMTVTNIVYTKINMQNQPSQSAMPGMKWMMYLMPVMFLFFFNDYASALSYYYFLSMLLTIVQTWIFRKCVNEDKVRAQMMANAAKPRKKTGFMARLEEAQRKQQAMLREQQKRQTRR